MGGLNFNEVAWKETAILNLSRSVAAGIMWFLICWVGFNVASFVWLFFPVQYLLVLAPIGVLCSYLARVIPFVGLITLVLAVLIVVGDPIIFAITQLKPGLLPVGNYSPFNFVLVIYLLKD